MVRGGAVRLVAVRYASGSLCLAQPIAALILPAHGSDRLPLDVALEACPAAIAAPCVGVEVTLVMAQTDLASLASGNLLFKQASGGVVAISDQREYLD